MTKSRNIMPLSELITRSMRKKMEITTHTHLGVEKTKRYGWVTKDEPGELLMLHKDALQIHPGYQRDVVVQKVTEITAAWSWLGCGALIVGRRGGEYWIVDGQHRALAAKRRSDITHLPCVVFETIDVKQEARGFLDANTGRKPVSAIAKQKALVAAGDEVAGFVQKTLQNMRITIKTTANKARELKCIAWCMRRAAENREAFCVVMAMAAELCDADNMAIPERVLEGLWIINSKCEKGLEDKRLVKRLREKGGRSLLDAANRASAYYASGGGKIWAQGILAELNKGLQNKFTMDGKDA